MTSIDAHGAPSDHVRMRNVIGCMTGTSIDAVDVALVAIEGTGLDIRAAVSRCGTRPLGSLAAPLRRLATLQPVSAREIAALARDFALRHVEGIREVVQSDRIDLIAVHGQTVFHDPPLSWQLLSPVPIAQAFGVPVVYDLRAADLAAGGQGAPITPLADHVMFGSTAETRVIINLGGFANYTLLPRRAAGQSGPPAADVDAIRGGDICACNQLLDRLASELFGEPFDWDGGHAAAGRVRSDLRDSLAGLLRQQARAGRSLGTGDELAIWVREYRDTVGGADLCRSACEALAIVITDAVAEASQTRDGRRPDRILLAGGGAKNRVLRDALGRLSPAPVAMTDNFGVPADYREAAAMAVLGALCQDRVPITLPAVTGVSPPAPVAGVWVDPRRA